MQKESAAWTSDGSADVQCTGMASLTEGGLELDATLATSNLVPNLLLDNGRKVESNTIVTTSPESPSASPASQLATTELEELYVGGKTAINRAKKDLLARLYSYLTGATFDDCSRLTRDHLKELIFTLVGISQNPHLFSNINLIACCR
jgi:hypothetical protein